ncbi:hypothetical protein DFH28DRAFT_309761 [Melampsora americana]|nr:hypothetical protein DFH28DRAFT_309761 [Melampsora americana]
MENPVTEIEDVVRSITEPYSAKVIAQNIDKYFTRDAKIIHPTINQPYSKDNGREDLKGIYKMFRTQTIDNKIIFHAVMFNHDKTECAIDLSEQVTTRNPILRYISTGGTVRLIVKVSMRECEDGKYRIYLQEDNAPTDLTRGGWPIASIPGVAFLNDLIKYSAGFWISKLGLFLYDRGWFDV